MTNILLIEDDPNLAELYQETLTDERFGVRAVADGALALATARDYQPDLILLDLLLPGIDGSTLLRMFKEDDKLRSVPVIILTNISSADKIKELMTIGASDYILKVDVTPDEVVRRIRKVLKLPMPPEPEKPQLT